MQCPNCLQNNTEMEDGNQFFLGRNSRQIPFYKCSNCGSMFMIDPSNKLPRLVERVEKGSRMIPLIWAAIYLVSAGAMYWYFGSNLVTWILGGIILLFALQAVRICFSGSQQLIDEMTVDEGKESSKRAKEEFRKLSGLD